jgi:tRNA threonylcarbamoyladenosine biosynthesis protein TsaB
MIILGLDTSTLSAGVAVWDGDGARLLAESRRAVTTHSEFLVPLIDETLRRAGLRVAEVGGIACGAGPGSFTGLRIGLATAKGLCFALGRPLALVSSLAAVAARAPDGRVCATLDAHKAEVYAAVFEVRDHLPLLVDEELVLPPAALAARLAALAPLDIVGGGALRYRELIAPGVRLLDEEEGPRPGDVARLGGLRLLRGEGDDLAASGPRYIRPSEAELAKLKPK